MSYYGVTARERTMKVQEVILRAMAKKITWWQVAEIMGISDWQGRRSRAMRDTARRPERDRAELFRATAQAMRVHEVIVEKDFWVSWMLDYLFHDSPRKDRMAFKGGTGLSVFERYNIVSDRDLKMAAEKMESRFRKSVKSLGKPERTAARRLQ